MELSYIKKIIRLVENSDVDEVEIEEEGKKIRVARHRTNSLQYAIPASQAFPQINPAVQSSPDSERTPQPPSAPKIVYHEVKSPIVGTFYRSPAPDAEAYVEIGQDVKPGTVLCIVEAMKLMNEIECDTSGKIAKIMVENGTPVEYNQVLFLVET